MAPHVLPCSHVFSLAGIQELSLEAPGREVACPRCRGLIQISRIASLPRHKKLCTLVRLLESYRADPSHLFLSLSPDAKVYQEYGWSVYQGTLKTEESVREVSVSEISMTGNEARAKSAWRELVLLLQLTETLGKQVVRVLGYVEKRRESLRIIVEGSSSTVARLLKAGKLSVAQTMRMARHVINTLLALHNRMHHVHADVCPANVHCWGCGSSSSRYSLTGFTNAHAWVAPHGGVPVAHLHELPSVAQPYAAPERCDRNARITDRTDVWAFAATLWHCLTGELPHSTSPGGAQGRPKSHVPTAVLQLLEECLTPISAQRPSAQQLAARWATLEEEWGPLAEETAAVKTVSVQGKGQRSLYRAVTRTSNPGALDALSSALTSASSLRPSHRKASSITDGESRGNSATRELKVPSQAAGSSARESVRVEEKWGGATEALLLEQVMALRSERQEWGLQKQQLTKEIEQLHELIGHLLEQLQDSSAAATRSMSLAAPELDDVLQFIGPS